MKNIFCISIITLFLTTSTVGAHSLWVNCFDSTKIHQPGHATISLGWGHTMPIDDMPNSVMAKLNIAEFNLADPAGNRNKLYKPEPKTVKAFKSNANYDLYISDVANQQIALKKETKQGVYLIAAVSQKATYTQYIDTKGRTRFALKPMDAIDGIQKVLSSVQYQAFAKSYLAVGKWTMPRPAGHDLEITPLTDLSRVKPGDMVEFDVRFHGKPMTWGPNSQSYITGYSPSFGGERFAVFSMVLEGKAQFKVQNAGQWRVNILSSKMVTQDGPLKDLYGKVKTVNNAATLTFTVRP
nr:DUF4198 domain-containing protein [uncultured Desulfobacter sp.]